MFDLLFDNGAAWFSIPAIVGTVFFTIRIVLLLVGGAADMDLDLDADVSAPDHVVDHLDSTHAFQILSIQSVAAFMMGFGWGGLGALRGADGWAWWAVMASAIAGGAVMVWLLGLTLKAVYDLQASGNVAIDAAMGREGEVYCAVPARGEGRGQVRITVQQRQRIYNAVTEGEALPTSTRVKVTRVNGDNTLTVIRA